MLARLYFEMGNPNHLDPTGRAWNELFVSISPDNLIATVKKYENFVVCDSEGNDNEARKTLRHLFERLLKKAPSQVGKNVLCFHLSCHEMSDREFRKKIFSQFSKYRGKHQDLPSNLENRRMTMHFPKYKTTVVVQGLFDPYR